MTYLLKLKTYSNTII